MAATPLYGPRVAATGVLLLGLGALLAIGMWRSTIGPFSFGLVAEPTREWRVALWSAGDDAGRAHSAERWNARFDGRFALDLLTRHTALAASRDSFDLLVVDGVALGAVEAEWLRGFVEKGGRLALFGCGDSGNAEHAVALSAVVGEPLRAARDYRWTLLPARPGPLAAGFAADARLPLRRAHNVYALPGAATRAEVVWAPAAPEASPASASQGAVWRRQIGAGRMVWWAVRPDVALDRVDAQTTMTRMVRASAAWLLEEPFAELVSPGRDAEGLEVRVTRRSRTRFLLSVTNRGPEPSAPLEIRVHLNRRVDAVTVERTAVSLRPGGLTPPVYALAESGREMTLTSGPFGADESRSYYLDLQEAKTSP